MPFFAIRWLCFLQIRERSEEVNKSTKPFPEKTKYLGGEAAWTGCNLRGSWHGSPRCTVVTYQLFKKKCPFSLISILSFQYWNEILLKTVILSCIHHHHSFILLKNILFIYLSMYFFIVIAGLSVCMCGCMCVMAWIWMSETTDRSQFSPFSMWDQDLNPGW